MSRYRDDPATEAALAETFGRKPKHTAAELASLAETEHAAVVSGLTAEIESLAVSRLGKSAGDAAWHARLAVIDAREAAGRQACGLEASPARIAWHLRETCDKLRRMVPLGAGSSPAKLAAGPSREHVSKALAETFGGPTRTGRDRGTLTPRTPGGCSPVWAPQSDRETASLRRLPDVGTRLEDGSLRRLSSHVLHRRQLRPPPAVLRRMPDPRRGGPRLVHPFGRRMVPTRPRVADLH